MKDYRFSKVEHRSDGRVSVVNVLIVNHHVVHSWSVFLLFLFSWFRRLFGRIFDLILHRVRWPLPFHLYPSLHLLVDLNQQIRLQTKPSFSFFQRFMSGYEFHLYCWVKLSQQNRFIWIGNLSCFNQKIALWSIFCPIVFYVLPKFVFVVQNL